MKISKYENFHTDEVEHLTLRKICDSAVFH